MVPVTYLGIEGQDTGYVPGRRWRASKVLLFLLSSSITKISPSGLKETRLKFTMIKSPVITQNINQQLTGSPDIVHSCRAFCLCQEIFEKNTCLHFYKIMEATPQICVDDKLSCGLASCINYSKVQGTMRLMPLYSLWCWRENPSDACPGCCEAAACVLVMGNLFIHSIAGFYQS